jgi:hypothetical protein
MEIELSSLDLRFEYCRMKSSGAEKALLMSIMEKGIRDPLQGVETADARILLDGFKRVRCAKKLGIGIAPFVSIGADEALGIIQLIRISNEKSLSILEQARFVDELKTTYKMSTAEIAKLLERSKPWVSIRSGIIAEMSDYVLEQMFKGRFPVYSYMYTLRPFIRINGIQNKELDEFVRSVAGKNLSIRNIEILANGYFRGSEALREQIKNGHITWALGQLKQSLAAPQGCSKVESAILRDLEIVLKYMQRVAGKIKHSKHESGAFLAQANLLTGGILRKSKSFLKAIRCFHDRTGQA